MSERDTSARGKPSEPPYAKYAFANPYNLSLLVGAGSAALLTGHWWVGLCAVAAEAVWMLFAPDSRLLQKKWFDPIWEGEQQEARKARQAAKFNALPDAEKERALRLRDQQKRIEKMAQDNASFSVDLLSSDIAKLEDLVDDFLDMAQVASRYEAYLKDMNLVEIEKDITRYGNQVDKLPVGDERRKVAQKNLEVLLSRKDRYLELRRNLQTARGQMDLMENTFRLLSDEIVGMQNPSELGARLDELREGVAAVRETSRETERYMQGTTR
ncbi:MAG TPA: hypothetical protein PK472_16545 [Pseudomonadota bacterium]|nr:hypothetical protein [Pseudomonadota bacterium]